MCNCASCNLNQPPPLSLSRSGNLTYGAVGFWFALCSGHGSTVQYNPGERQAPYYTSFVGRDRCPRNRPPSMAKRTGDRVVARARAQACILAFSHSLFSTIHIIRTRVIRGPILICSDLTTSEGVPSALKLTWKPRPLPQLQARAINTVYQLLQ